MSLLVNQFGHSPIPGDATYAIILTLFSGLIQLVMGILHIGESYFFDFSVFIFLLYCWLSEYSHFVTVAGEFFSVKFSVAFYCGEWNSFMNCVCIVIVLHSYNFV